MQSPPQRRAAKVRPSTVLSIAVAANTVLALAAVINGLAAVPDTRADGPAALRKSIGEWHARGADRLMKTMLSRQRRLVPDGAEESAAHQAMADDEKGTSPIVPPIVPQIVPVALPAPPLPVHHRRVEVTETGLASIDLSALSATADAPEGLIVEGIPNGLVPMTGTSLDDNRWKVDAGDLGAFALVLGVNPPEQFELRLARHAGAGGYRTDTSIVIDLVVKPPEARPSPQPTVAALPPSEPTPRQLSGTSPAKSERRSDRAKIVRKAKADAAPVARTSAEPPAGVTIAPRPKAMGVGIRPSRAEKPVAPKASAADTPWWSKPVPFKLEDSREQR